MKHTITINEVKTMYEEGINTFSRKDNNVRGISTISGDEVKIGDIIVINNYFHEVIA